MGDLPVELVHPYPEEDTAIATPEAKAFLTQLESFLKEHVDPDQIDIDGEIPDHVIEGLAAIGAFGIKIPREYGGLGLSQQLYTRAAVLVGSYCGSISALLVGAPIDRRARNRSFFSGPKTRSESSLPRDRRWRDLGVRADRDRSVGSDPARMETRAVPTEDGKHYIINGEKLWCTNGTRAGLLVVMAKTPARVH